MSLFRKILLAPALAVALMLCVSLLAVRAMGEQRAQLAALADVRMAHATFAQETRAAVLDVHTRAYRVLTWSASLGSSYVDQESAKLVGDFDQAAKGFTRWAASGALANDERASAAAVVAAAGKYHKALATALDMASADVASGVTAMQTADDHFKQLDKETQALVALEQRSAHQAVAAADAAYRQTLWINGTLVVAATAAAIAMSLLIARRATQSLSQAVDVARAVAAGDLQARVPAGGGDEVGRLLQALEAMRANLADIARSVRMNAESVAVASAEIAQGNGDLSMRTERQASVLEQTASSMEELGGAVRQNAEHARAANELASGASSIARRGGEVVGQVVHTMKDINDASHRIADILGVIDGIAFQTNILALNAAVEAARAGDSGRGFAVVAGEVRGLAQRSAGAAKEIRGLISASVERAERGSALVDEAGTTMGEIVASVQRVSELMAEISVACSEQSSGVGHVGAAVSQMDAATQQNAALVEEGAAAAESLKLQARQLLEAVAVFKLA